MLAVLMLLLGVGSPEPAEVCTAPAWMLTRPLKAACDIRDSAPYGARTKADVLSATVSGPGGTMTFRWLKDYPLAPEEWDRAAALIGPEGGFVGVDGAVHGVGNIWSVPATDFGAMLVGTIGALEVKPLPQIRPLPQCGGPFNEKTRTFIHPYPARPDGSCVDQPAATPETAPGKI